MIKPRIRKVYLLPLYWVCYSKGQIGYGTTIEHAYAAWKINVGAYQL